MTDRPDDWLQCLIEDCDKPTQHRYGRWCAEHLARYRRHGDPLTTLGVGRRTIGDVKTPTYETWKAMRTRCLNPNREFWQHYGGRGITICDRWESFENFFDDMGERPVGRTLDRIDVNGNYEPSNCRWATPSEQRLNQREKEQLGPYVRPTEIRPCAVLGCPGDPRIVRGLYPKHYTRFKRHGDPLVDLRSHRAS